MRNVLSRLFVNKWNRNNLYKSAAIFLFLVLFYGCSPVNNNPQTNLIVPIIEPSNADTIVIPTRETPIVLATLKPTTLPTVSSDKNDFQNINSVKNWQDMPVIPVISQRAIQIFLDGLEKGNNPHSFSKIGDCESRTTWFLSDFDAGESYYNLGDYQDLKPIIDYYQGSFGRLSIVARPGFSAASVMVPLWADKKLCEKNETPLACEYRLNNPGIAFIMLGTNDIYQLDNFEENMRRILDYSIESGVVPILATKADNLEGDHYINSVIVRLANEYEIPLWNFWAAVQSLPDQGLQEDGAHLTWGPNQFDDSNNMKRAWPVRNLSALQVLEAIWKEFSPQIEVKDE